jgi:hypothetical protein
MFMGWVAATEGYEVSVEGETVLCRNKSGKPLKSIPAKVKNAPAYLQLRQLTDWLGRHTRECREQVERWMVRSLPVPVAVIAEVWPDTAWQDALRELVLAPALPDGTPDLDRAGLLRDADRERGIGLVTLDGETVRIGAGAQGTGAPGTVLIPHPVLLHGAADLDELREFAAESEIRQGVEQLFREVWHKPAGTAPDDVRVSTYAEAQYEQLRHLLSRAADLGYRVRSGEAVCPVLEGGRQVEARVWVGDDWPEGEAETGPLAWNDTEGRLLTLGEVGPVAWSEGMRMAAALHAGRVVQEAQV